MIIALSPYHLTTREVPAMASLLLATRVVTFMPGVFRQTGEPRSGGGRDDLQARARHSARYARVLESWQWSMPLWREGLIESSISGDDAADDMRFVWEKILTDGRYAPLRPFMKPSLADDTGELVEAVAKDVLRGGPDPALSVPLAAGLDRFAARHGLVVARGKASSLAQCAETALGECVTTLVIPGLVQASGERIFETRRTLARELADLRGALASPVPSRKSPALLSAARAYEKAFDAMMLSLDAQRDPHELRVIASPLSLTLQHLPADAVLRSSAEAARTVLGARSSREPNGAQTQTLPVVCDISERTRIMTLVIKALGR
jgi:hypothetical protein